MVILDNPLVDTNTESQTINAFQTNGVAGIGPYNNPLDIYLPGHRTYLDIPFGENSKAGISGIVKNINLLKEGYDLKVLPPEETIRIFDPILTEDFIIDNNNNGLSVNLKFGSYNVITAKENIFKNL